MIKVAILLKRAKEMSHQEFIDYQREVFTPLLLSIPETRRYIRKFVVSQPVPEANGPAPDYDMMVEVWFDHLDDVDAFFQSDNFLKIVDPDHANFIDLSSVVRIVSQERVLIG